MSASPRFVQVRDAAEQLGVHTSTLRRWVDQGRMPAIKLPSGTRRFQQEDVDRMRRYMYDDELRATLEHQQATTVR